MRIKWGCKIHSVVSNLNKVKKNVNISESEILQKSQTLKICIYDSFTAMNVKLYTESLCYTLN